MVFRLTPNWSSRRGAVPVGARWRARQSLRIEGQCSEGWSDGSGSLEESSIGIGVTWNDFLFGGKHSAELPQCAYFFLEKREAPASAGACSSGFRNVTPFKEGDCRTVLLSFPSCGEEGVYGKTEMPPPAQFAAVTTLLPNWPGGDFIFISIWSANSTAALAAGCWMPSSSSRRFRGEFTGSAYAEVRDTETVCLLGILFISILNTIGI